MTVDTKASGKSADSAGSEVREQIRSAVTSNGGMALGALKSLFPGGDVPHIKMGQLRKLIEDRISVYKRQAEEANKRMEELRIQMEEALRQARDSGAKAERDQMRARIEELEAQLKQAGADVDHQLALQQNEMQRLKGLLEGIDLQDEERIRRIAELEDQLKAARDALAEAKKEIRRLLSELRYAEPIVMPDHAGYGAVLSEVRDLAGRSQNLTPEAGKALRDALHYAQVYEETCMSELPKLLERMNNREASFPSVARMLKLANLHQEQRRWLGVIGGILGGSQK